jgi:hypothetical protein
MKPLKHVVPLLALLASTAMGQAQQQLSLLQSIAQWQYPGAKMKGGATMSDAGTTNSFGERTIQSVQCKAILTTEDAISEVVEYYKNKPTPVVSKASASEEKTTEASGRSVTFHEDSEGRPVAIHVILINTDKTSTTLVISRAATESETHIAWTQYRKL